MSGTGLCGPARVRVFGQVFALGLLPLLAAGCKSAPPARPSGILWLNLSPPSATVIVDEQPVAAQPGAVTLRISLRPGPHRLMLRAPGHFTAYRDLDIVSAGERHLDVALRPDPDAEPELVTPARPLGELLPRPLPMP
jgi:hypothetical protein